MLLGSIHVIQLYIQSMVDTHAAWVNINLPTSLRDLPGPGFNVLRTLFAFIARYLYLIPCHYCLKIDSTDFPDGVRRQVSQSEKASGMRELKLMSSDVT